MDRANPESTLIPGPPGPGPECGHAKTETMPTDACQWFDECEACHALLRPRPGDCCVYCSYGSVPCPSRQDEAGGCCDHG
jgi:hypothetical protein